MGLQFVHLVFAVVATIFLKAEAVVLETVLVGYVCPSSWLELVKLVSHIWGRMK